MKNTIEFYELLYNLVKGWPVITPASLATTGIDAPFLADLQKANATEVPCLRLNTFAVLRNDSDLNSDTLHKDQRYIGKNLFYSRLWADAGLKPSEIKISYPALFVYVGNLDLHKKEDCIDSEIELTLRVMDRAPRIDNGEFRGNQVCEKRTWEQVEDHTQFLMENVMAMLLQTISASVTYADTSTGEIWAPNSSILKMLSDGVITDYQEGDSLCNYLVDNDGIFESVTLHESISSQELIGTSTRLRMQLSRVQNIISDFSVASPIESPDTFA